MVAIRPAPCETPFRFLETGVKKFREKILNRILKRNLKTKFQDCTQTLDLIDRKASLNYLIL